jgi:hypothetical protein
VIKRKNIVQEVATEASENHDLILVDLVAALALADGELGR